jgi:hypothetical protein
MNNNDLKHRFDELKAKSLQKDAKIYGTDLWGMWHDFADIQYEPAKEFFIERLNDIRPNWRAERVSMLGFHYKLDNDVLDKIRDLLVHDIDTDVRMTAPSVLGTQGQYPERTIVYALERDASDLVRESAFDALLQLAGMPFRTIRVEVKRIKAKEIVPSLDQVRRVLREQNLLSQASLLDELQG